MFPDSYSPVRVRSRQFSLGHIQFSCSNLTDLDSDFPVPARSRAGVAQGASFRFCFLLAYAITILGGTCAYAQNRFAPVAPSFSSSEALAYLVAVEDFNHDGYKDALMASINDPGPGYSLELMPGNSNGGFGSPVLVIPNVFSFLVGDFNGDGIPDIAALVTPVNLAQVEVYINNGDGTFKAGTPSSTLFLTSATLAVAADFNGDGNLDVVVTDSVDHQIVVLPGDGHGNLGAPVVSAMPTLDAPGPTIAADVTGDGVLDLVLTNSGTNSTNGTGTYLRIMVGNGRGGFTLGRPINTKAALINSLAAGDLEGNGKTELVLATGISFLGTSCSIGPGVAVLTPNANGDWTETDYPTGVGSWVVTIADMNGDGLPDIVSANFTGTFSVLLNQGRKAAQLFAPALSYGGAIYQGNFDYGDSAFMLGQPQMFVTDVTGDGSPDIVLAADGVVSVERNLGDGHFLAGQSIDAAPVGEMDVADLNHDGIPDVAFIGASVLLGYLDCPVGGEFFSLVSENGLPLQKLNPGVGATGMWMALGDLNGDGNQDAVLGSLTQMEVLLNNGSGVFSPPSNPIIPGASTEGDFVLGNFNADAYSDLAYFPFPANELNIQLGEGNGQFGPVTAYVPGALPSGVTSGVVGPIVKVDLNGDQHTDLVYTNAYTNTVEVLLGNGDGTFQQVKSYPAGTNPYVLAFGDFNRDGKVDLVVGTLNGVSILFGNGDGTFSAPTTIDIPSATNPTSIAVADLRGIGIDDLILPGYGASGQVTYVLSGDGKGGFGAPVSYSGAGGSIVAADFNGDGAIDLLETGGPMVLYNMGGTYVSISSSTKRVHVGEAVTFTADVVAAIQGAGTPTGAVKFKSSTELLGSATLRDGKATFTTSALSVGYHWVTASYQGSSDFNQRTSASVVVEVQARTEQ